jgi:hypothetical protein
MEICVAAGVGEEWLTAFSLSNPLFYPQQKSIIKLAFAGWGKRQRSLEKGMRKATRLLEAIRIKRHLCAQGAPTNINI